jgi:hypothetical protein
MITATTNIKTEQQAQAAMLDTLKNPPKSPIQAFQWLTKNVNFSSAFGSSVAKLIPGIGQILGPLTDIFSAFSSAPSLGEMVIDGLNSLSTQIADLKNELTGTIERTAEIQTARTVDFVLQGVDEIQREVSAIQVMQSVTAESLLQDVAAQKAEIYTEYLTQYGAMQSAAYAEISDIVNRCEAELTDLYASLVLRFGEMGLDFFKYLESLTAASPAPAIETRSAPGVVETAVQSEEKTGFNWLYLSPLLLLFLAKKKK